MVIGGQLLPVNELAHIAYEEGTEFDPAEATSASLVVRREATPPGLAMNLYPHANKAPADRSEAISDSEEEFPTEAGDDDEAEPEVPRSEKSWDIGISDIVEPLFQTQY
jgi:hypothetical protein